MAGYADPVGFYVEKLAEGIAQIAAAFAPEPVIVRLSDFKSNEYANLIGGSRYEPHEENPMLGFRGASRYVDESFRPCFELECRALKRVREDMGLTNVQVMVPFVRTRRRRRAQVTELLAHNGLKRGEHGLKVIMMCELPTNALLAEQYLEYFDGMSIGSNDMTQLTLGLDRDSAIVAQLFDERDEAVRKLLSMAIAACRRHGKYVGICGQGPSDHPDLARWLLEQGIESMSLNPDTVVETWLFLAQASRGRQARLSRAALAARLRRGCCASAASRSWSSNGSICRLLDGRVIETACIDAVAVGVGARHVEGLHPAAAAEQMARGAGVEGVLGEPVRARAAAESASRGTIRCR